MSDKRGMDFKVRRAEQRPSRFAALLLFVIAAAGLFVSLLPDMLFASRMEGLSPAVRELISQLVYYLPFAALPVAIELLLHREHLDAYRPNPLGVFAALMIAGLALLTLLFIDDLQVLWAIPWEESGVDLFAPYASTYVPATRGELVLRILTVGVIPAVCEEAVFRGAILGAIEPQGTKRAMVLTALLFAALHGSPAGLPGQIIVGLILAYLVIMTDSIYSAVIFHTVYNSAAVILQFVQRGLPEAEGTLLTRIGGASGLLVLAFEMLMALLPMTLILRLFAMYGRARGVQPFPKTYVKRTAGETALLIVAILLIAALFAFVIMSYFKG